MQARGFEIGLELGEMEIREGSGRFEFQDDLCADDEVKASNALILFLEKDVDFLLPLKWDASVTQGDFHRLLINRFNKTRSERFVDINRRADNPVGQFLKLMSHCLLSCFPSFVLS